MPETVNDAGPNAKNGLGMPDSPMSPRVRLIQFLAIACPMMTKPSVHITKEVARSLSAGMPSGNAMAPASNPAARKFR